MTKRWKVMKIKKGKLNYDQSGRAYPPNPRVDENWSCIWEYEGKYYKLVGDNEHKEWDEVNIYNQIINEAYENYVKQNDDTVGRCDLWTLKKEEFINICKTNPEFSEKWGLKIEERELSLFEKTTLYSTKTGQKDWKERVETTIENQGGGNSK
jgi:hypothetical protein